MTPATCGSMFVLMTGITASVLSISSCRVDPEDFNRRVFACNIASPDPGCGTDETGRPMACFAARQIGAPDFCAKTCDEPLSTTGEAVCLASGISLSGCHPSDGTCAQQGLACYRTDLLSDEGVCTTMNPCNADTDCRDPVRSVCATTFLASLYAGATLQRDHLYCLQTGCRSRGTACSPGETCLQEVITPAAHPPDICVPNCDSNLRCPPNFLCYRKVSTSIAPNVCIPGLLGFTCDDPIDCMLGQCVDNGEGYKVCTTHCNADADCRQFDGEQGRFICIKNAASPTEPGYCQTPDSYRGSICATTADCTPRNPDAVCSRFNPKDAAGNCLVPCPADGKCGHPGGINQTCLPSVVNGAAASVCFPGYFGFPCLGDSNCVDDLTCRPTVTGAPNICTRTCASTADCGANRWIGGEGWCQTQLGICLGRLDDAKDCAVDEACKSGRCLANKCATTGAP